MAQSEAPRKLAVNLEPGDQVFTNIATLLNNPANYVWLEVVRTDHFDSDRTVQVTYRRMNVPVEDQGEFVYLLDYSTPCFISRITANKGK